MSAIFKGVFESPVLYLILTSCASTEGSKVYSMYLLLVQGLKIFTRADYLQTICAGT